MVNPVSHNAAHDMFEADAASRALGIELIEASGGHAVTRMRVTAEDVTVERVGEVVAEFRGRSRVVGK